MDGGRATSGAGALSGNLTGRVISACFALASFAVAILAGLASENPASRILGRALIAMMVCYPVGMLVGMVCERIIAALALTEMALVLERGGVVLQGASRALLESPATLDRFVGLRLSPAPRAAPG
jgi:hypothetical protein